jgi:hypothetical protein
MISKKIKQIAPLLATPLLLASATHALAASGRSYLFTLVGQHANVRQLSPNNYRLSMQLPAQTPITMFSDRPYRTITAITGSHFQQIWKQGDNSFAKNPPNAVLTTTGLPAEFITLSGLKLKNNQLSVDFSLMSAGANLPSHWTTGSNLAVDMTIH